MTKKPDWFKPAEKEFRIRRNDLNARRMFGAEKKFNKARHILEEELHCIRQGRRDEADAAYRNAERHFYEALGHVVNPEVAGVEAEDLGRRNFGSESVALGTMGEADIGWQWGEKKTIQRETGRKQFTDEASLITVFSELAKDKRVTPLGILEQLPPEQVIALLTQMMADANSPDRGSFTKRKAVLDTIVQFFRYTEPKVLVQEDLSIDEWDEETTKQAIREMSRVLHHKDE